MFPLLDDAFGEAYKCHGPSCFTHISTARTQRSRPGELLLLRSPSSSLGVRTRGSFHVNDTAGRVPQLVFEPPP